MTGNLKEKHTLIFSYLAFLIPFFQIQNCTAQCVYIDPNISVPSPCDPKSGYNLIISDECNVFNASLWDKSSPGDDLPGYGDPLLCTYLGSENAPKNETNVSAAGGTYNLRVRQGEEQNMCSHSSAEIKTFNNVSEGNTFRSWKVFKDSYVEVRYRMPSCKGIGSAFWLYSVLPGKFYEIDIHEQDPAKPDQVNSNIHFGPGYDHETSYPVDTKFCSLNGNSISLEGRFLTYGVAINEEGISMYLNGVFFRHHPFSNSSPYNISSFPFTIRIGVGSTTHGHDVTDCKELPQFLNIDYVRVYKKNDIKAVKFLYNRDKLTLCNSNSCPQEYCNWVYVNYFPSAIYEWEPSSFFNITNESGTRNDQEVFAVHVNPGTPSGTYLLNLNVYFPCGYVEALPLTIKVLGSPPLSPTDIKLYKDNNFVFYPGVPVSPNTNSYEWSLNGGVFGNQINPPNGLINIWDRPFYASHQPQQVQICAKAKNACSTSAAFCKTFIVPANSGGYSGGHDDLLPPIDIIMEPNVLKPLYDSVKENEVDREESNSIRYIYYNCLGQVVQNGSCDDTSEFPILREGITRGLYILVKFNQDKTINSVSKLMFMK